VYNMPIIINGEIVPDDDPRAVAKRRGSATTQQQQQQPRRGIATLGSTGANTGGRNSQQQQQQQQQNDPMGGLDGLLSPLSRMLNIEGKRLMFPPIPYISFQGFGLPYIALVVAFATYIIPETSLQQTEIIMISITAACTFAIIDMYAPTVYSNQATNNQGSCSN